MATLDDLSIIIPAFNAANCLERTLRSLAAAGAIEAREVIVVDDGSTDDTAAVAEACRTWLHNLHVVRQQNRGPGGARNNGLQVSSGRYVHFIDADDELVENAYHVLSPMLAKDPALIEFDYLQMHRRGHLRPKVSIPDEGIKDGVAGEVAVLHSGLIWTKLIRRDLAEQLPFPESRLFEDEPVMGMLPFLDTPVIKLNKPLYIYNYVPQSITRSFSHRHLLDREAMALAYEANGRQLGLDRRFPDAFEFRCFRLYANALWVSILKSDLPNRRYLAKIHGEKVRDKFPNIEKNPYFQQTSWRRQLATRLLMSSLPSSILPELLLTRRLRLA